MSMSDFLEVKILQHLGGIATWSAPGTLYLALHTADPGDTGSASEASGGSYARRSMAGNWTYNGGAARLENTASVTFPNMPSGTFSHWSLKDASSGGNTLVIGSFTSPQTLTVGQSLIVQAADLRITAD